MVIQKLWEHGVQLEGCLLKPQMVIPGADSGSKATSQEIALHTIAALRRWVGLDETIAALMQSGDAMAHYRGDATKRMVLLQRSPVADWT